MEKILHVKNIHNLLMELSLAALTLVGCQKDLSSDFLLPPATNSPIPINKGIIYTDVVPDSTLSVHFGATSTTYNLDINRDGINDIMLGLTASIPMHCSFGKNSKISTYPLNSSAVSSLKLTLNDKIGTNISWQVTPQNLRSSIKHCVPDFGVNDGSYTYSGNWNSSTDGYLAFKLNSNTKDYFGWVSLSITVSPFGPLARVKDYAYNSNPNQQILAGQTK